MQGDFSSSTNSNLFSQMIGYNNIKNNYNEDNENDKKTDSLDEYFADFNFDEVDYCIGKNDSSDSIFSNNDFDDYNIDGFEYTE